MTRGPGSGSARCSGTFLRAGRFEGSIAIVGAVYAGDEEAALDHAWARVRLAREIGPLETASALTTLARIDLWAGSGAAAEATARQVPESLPEAADDGTRRDLEAAALRLRVEGRLVAGDALGAGILLERLRVLCGEENAWLRQGYRFVEGMVLLESGRPERALRSLAGAFDEDPRLLRARARALLMTVRDGEALRVLRKIVEQRSPSLSHALVYRDARSSLEEEQAAFHR